MIVRCWNKVESMANKAHLKSHSLPERTSFKEGHKKFSDDDEQFSKHSWRGWYQHLHHFSRTSDSCWMFDKETSYVTWERKSTFQQELARSNQKTYNLLSWGKYNYMCMQLYNYFALQFWCNKMIVDLPQHNTKRSYKCVMIQNNPL